ncbi:MAG: DUF484 family protein [Roseobacter sp.]
MSSTPKLSPALRDAILARPQDILDDRDMMQALIEGNDKRMGENIVDLRGIAMERLEARLDRLEDTHRSVIAAAYDNLAGMHQIHRAALQLLEAQTLGDFTAILKKDVTEVLRIDAVSLVLEVTGEPMIDKACQHSVLSIMEAGFIADYLSQGSTARSKDVTLRKTSDAIWQAHASHQTGIRSEACIQLDLGSPDMGGLLILGAKNEKLFAPHQGTDLLTFMGGVTERLLRRFLP